jgi:hypothetical protein
VSAPLTFAQHLACNAKRIAEAGGLHAESNPEVIGRIEKLRG